MKKTVGKSMIGQKSFLKAGIRLMVVVMFMFSFLFVLVPMYRDPVRAASVTTGFTEYNTQNGRAIRYNSDASWSAAVTNTVATAISTDYGMVFNANGNKNCQRGMCFYDTSSIPDDATITAVSIWYPTLNAAYTATVLYVQNSNAGVSLGTNDYNRAKFGAQYAAYSWSSSTSAFNLTFNQNVSSSINVTGVSTFVVRANPDFYNIDPGATQYGFDCNDEDLIKLWVTYTTPVMPPSAPVYFEALSQNSSWIKLNWTHGATGVDKTVIRANIGSYPTLSVGSTIYNGTLHVYNHTGLTNNTHWFYRCYAWNTSYNGYNATSIRAHDTTMGITLFEVNAYGGSYTTTETNYSLPGYYEDTVLNQLPANGKDGDWDTSVALADRYYNIQYLKSTIYSGDMWTVKDAGGYTNFTVNSSWFNINSSSLYLTLVVQYSDIDWCVFYFIFAGINDTTDLYWLGSSSASGDVFYEEGITRMREGVMVDFTAYIMDIYVDDDFTSATSGWGVTHFDTIQDGIDAAPPGCTVYVWAGEYTENIYIDDSVNLVGNGSATTTIHGALADFYAIEIEVVSYVNISGFFFDDCDIAAVGGGGDNVSIYDNKFTTDFLGLWMTGCEYYYIHDNNFTGMPVGIVLTGVNTTKHMFIYDNVFYDNDIGIRFADVTSDILIYNNFFNNTVNYEVLATGFNNWFNISRTTGVNIIGGPYLGGNYYSNNTGANIGNGFTVPYPYTYEVLDDLLPLSYYYPSFCIVNQTFFNCTGFNTTWWNGTAWIVNTTATGNTTPINLVDYEENCTGSLIYDLNSTGYWVTSDHIGNLTPLHLLEYIVNATGTHTSTQNITGYWVTAIFDGVLTPLHIVNNSVNCTGTISSSQNGTGHWVDVSLVGSAGAGGATVYIPIPGHSSLVQPVSITLGMCLVAPVALLIGRRRRRGDGSNEN